VKKGKEFKFYDSRTNNSSSSNNNNSNNDYNRKQFCGKKVLHLVFDVHKKAA
jgi:hypothetical protein